MVRPHQGRQGGDSISTWPLPRAFMMESTCLVLVESAALLSGHHVAAGWCLFAVGIFGCGVVALGNWLDGYDRESRRTSGHPQKGEGGTR
jgi:hypothetical protein